MFSKPLNSILVTLVLLACSNKQGSDTNLNRDKPENILATWVSQNAHSFQILELKDSSNALVYWADDGSRSTTKAPYFFKANGVVTDWTFRELKVQTDKYNLQYDIYRDTLYLKDESGVIEKLIRVWNDTVGRRNH